MPRPIFNLYNTLSREVAPLVPLDPEGKRVSLYVCGPTIYDFAHIGNFRTYVAVDLLRRTLKHFGFVVDHVMQFHRCGRQDDPRFAREAAAAEGFHGDLSEGFSGGCGDVADRDAGADAECDGSHPGDGGR